MILQVKIPTVTPHKSGTHSEAVVAFETALRYVDEHRDSTAADVIHLRRWLRTVSAARYSYTQYLYLQSNLGNSNFRNSNFWLTRMFALVP